MAAFPVYGASIQKLMSGKASNGPEEKATGALTPKQAGYDLVQTPRFSPERMQQIEQLRGQAEPGALGGTDMLSRLAGGDQSMFQQLEAPALRQFQQLQGNIASRFSGVGARRSSGFQNAQTAAASDLAERLQGQRLGLQQNAISQLMGLYTNLLGQDPYEMQLMERQQPQWQKYLGASLPFIGAGVGALAGSFIPGVGTLAGMKLGGTLGGMGSKAFFD